MAISSQADQRAWMPFTDQHGRDWGAVVEIKSKGMVGGYHPQGWMAPFLDWMPPQNYIEQRDVKTKFMNLTINYDAWINELLAARDAYKQLVQQCVTSVPGAAIRDDGSLNPIAFGVVGKAPMSHRPVEAMKQGNAFALGMEDIIDERLRPYFPVVRAEDRVTPMDFSGPAPQIAPVEVLPEVETFACPACPRTFPRKAALMSHMRTHATPVEA